MPTPYVSLGLLGDIAVGWSLAIRHARRLLAVLLPLLAVALLGLLTLDLLLGRDQLVILDGALVVGDPGELGWAPAAVIVGCWVVGLTAGTATIAAAERGRPLGTLAALVVGITRIPVLAIAAALAFGAFTVAGGAFLLLGVAAGDGGATPGLFLILAVGAVLAVAGARLLIGLIASGGSAWTPTRGRVAATAGAVLLGGAGVPLVGAFLLDAGLSAIPPVARAPIATILLTGVLMSQAGILALTGLLQPAVPDPEPAAPATVDTGAVPEPAAPAPVDPGAGLAPTPPGDAVLPGEDGVPAGTGDEESGVGDGRGGGDGSGVGPGPGVVRGRRPWLAGVAALVALGAPAVIAVTNPLGVPTVRSHGDAPGDVAAIGWPAGKHPVMATVSGARFCDNDLCDRYVSHNGGPTVWDGYGTAAVSPDGESVLKAALTGGPESGGPFINFALCTRRGCPNEWFPVRASAKEPAGWSDLAVAVAPDQALWFGLATVAEKDESRFDITLIRCADADCAEPERHRAGSAGRDPEDALAGRRRNVLSIGADGRPTLVIRAGAEATTVTCDPVTCANPGTSAAFAGDGAIAWSADGEQPGRVLSFEPGRIRIGERMMPVQSGAIAYGSGAVTAAGPVVYATAAEAATPPGLHVSIGPSDEPTYWRQVLWRCDVNGCDRRVLDSMAEAYGREAIVVAADGRVLIVRQSRMLLLSGSADGRDVTA